MTISGTQTTWTAERIALLKNRIDAGLSCGQIAREMGLSRNAVIGKASRLGLSRFRGTRKNAQPRMATQRRILRSLWTKPHVAFPDAVDCITKRCSLFELQQWHCRWPIGDPTAEDFGFCGNKLIDGLPYCPVHARIAYRPDTRETVRQLHCVAACQ
jgi:GcrA cell cycle regulator